MVRLAASLAGAGLEGEHRHIRIVVLGVVTVPEETPLSQGASLVRAYRTMLHYINQDAGPDESVEVQTEVRVARQVWQGIADQVADEKADLLLLHWKGTTETPGKLYGDTLDALLAEPPCDVVLARFNNSFPEAKNILLPVRGGSYSTLALTLASNLAEEWTANITVLHSLGPNRPVSPRPALPVYDDLFGMARFASPLSEAEDETLTSLQNLVAELPPGARLVAMQGQVGPGIVREARFHDLIILGATDPNEHREETGSKLVGPGFNIAEHIAAETNCPLLVVKTRKPFELTRLYLGNSAFGAGREPSLEELVDRWFAENTFHYREFRTMSSLTLLKERHNQSVSLVLPVYGEVHPLKLAEMVRKARMALMYDPVLIDEIVICAPDGLLGQEEIATFNAPLLSGSGHVLPSQHEVIYYAPDSSEGAPPATQDGGPGLALWHALHRVRGDLVVWIDPAMVDLEVRLVYGLIGPLLSYPEFQFTTGFYSDTEDAGNEASQPVYNSLAEMYWRPLVGALQPQLSGVINPLCTVGAARRELLERLPLFTGTALTTALLLDTVQRNGLMSVAQVDLGLQPASSDEPLASQRLITDILAVVLRRVEERGHNPVLAGFNPAHKTIHKSGGVYSLKVEPPAVPPHELPPVAYTKGYKRRNFEQNV